MSVAAADPKITPALEPRATSVHPAVGLIVVCALFWLEFINHLKGEWSMNPQYSYGWCVPFLAAFLLWRRWEQRPAIPRLVRFSGLATTILAGTAIMLLPIRLTATANPDWRLVSWSLGILVVLGSLGCFCLLGSTSWLRYFAFPILFLLVAVPWPAQLEQAVVQTLMRLVTSINVFFLNLTGTIAVQQGNVIEVAAGPIGIEEACSGIRSLQATLMVSLFLGEFYSLTFWRRASLIALGALLAFVCNLVRTALLVWVGARHGVSAIGSWHDPAGWLILVVCLLGLWGTCLLLQREVVTLPTTSEVEVVSRQLSRGLPVSLVTFLVLCILVVEGGVLFWYRAGEPNKSSKWTVHWPKDEPNYQQVKVAPEAEGMLRYNEGGGGVWNDAAGRRWNMYFFRWLPGQTAALFVRNHRPDICLPASGMTMRGDEGLKLIAVDQFQLPMHAYRFDASGTPLHVYYCYWDGRASYSADDFGEDWTPSGRLKKVWQHKRESGTQMLELAVFGFADDAQARDALQRELKKIIRPG